MTDDQPSTPRPKSAALRSHLEAVAPIARGKQHLRAVLVEDDPMARRYLRELFYELSTQIDVRECETLENAFRYLERGDVDVVLLDLNLPDSSGRETFDLLHSRFPHVPVIVATGDDRIESALELIRDGAADFVLKSEKPISIFRHVVLAVERHRHTVPAPRDLVQQYRRLEKAEVGLSKAHSSGQHQAVKIAEVTAGREMITVTKSMFQQLMQASEERKTLMGKIEEMAALVKEHDRVLVRGTSDRPPLRHVVRDLERAVGQHREKLDSIEEIVEDKERDSVVMQVQHKAEREVLEAKHRYSTEHWALWQKVVAAVVAIVTTVVSGYLALRGAGKLVHEAAPPPTTSAR
jgi:DNA-binding NarL/FixJ family response regulator